MFAYFRFIMRSKQKSSELKKFSNQLKLFMKKVVKTFLSLVKTKINAI